MGLGCSDLIKGRLKGLRASAEDEEVTNWPRTGGCITVFSNCLHTKSFHVTRFLKPLTQSAKLHTKSPKPEAISQPLTQFSIALNTFFKALHTILFLKHKHLTGSDLLSFSKHNQSKCYTYSPGHTHTPHMCKHWLLNWSLTNHCFTVV